MNHDIIFEIEAAFKGLSLRMKVQRVRYINSQRTALTGRRLFKGSCEGFSAALESSNSQVVFLVAFTPALKTIIIEAQAG